MAMTHNYAPLDQLKASAGTKAGELAYPVPPGSPLLEARHKLLVQNTLLPRGGTRRPQMGCGCCGCHHRSPRVREGAL